MQRHARGELCWRVPGVALSGCGRHAREPVVWIVGGSHIPTALIPVRAVERPHANGGFCDFLRQSGATTDAEKCSPQPGLRGVVAS